MSILRTTVLSLQISSAAGRSCCGMRSSDDMALAVPPGRIARGTEVPIKPPATSATVPSPP